MASTDTQSRRQGILAMEQQIRDCKDRCEQVESDIAKLEAQFAEAKGKILADYHELKGWQDLEWFRKKKWAVVDDTDAFNQQANKIVNEIRVIQAEYNKKSKKVIATLETALEVVEHWNSKHGDKEYDGEHGWVILPTGHIATQGQKH